MMDSFIKGAKFAFTDIVRTAKKQRAEVVLFVFCNFLILTVFLFGTSVLLPEVCEGESWLVYLINYTWAVWVLICVLSNYHLLRIRNSSIQNHILIPPPQPPPEELQAYHQQQQLRHQQQQEDQVVQSPGGGDADVRHREPTSDLTQNLKTLAESFTSRPFNSDHCWHICGACETVVPPRSWHCNSCGTCIFRRDHHCIFAAACIGEDNQSNFLGFLFYLAAGSFYASVMLYIHMVHVLKISRWMWLVKCLFSIYTLLWDFSLESVLATLAFAACLASSSIFIYYIVLATRGQTAADYSKKISRHTPGEARYSYKNLENFLGPKPVLRILWPFHKLVLRSYERHSPAPKDL